MPGRLAHLLKGDEREPKGATGGSILLRLNRQLIEAPSPKPLGIA
jgi:hypothetical protein